MSMSKDSRTKLQKLLALARDPNATSHERNLAKSKAADLERKNPASEEPKMASFSFVFGEHVGFTTIQREANGNAERMRNWGWTGYTIHEAQAPEWVRKEEQRQREYEDRLKSAELLSKLRNAFKKTTTSNSEAIFCPMCGKEVQSFRRWVDKTKNEVILEYRHDERTHIGRFTSR